VWSLAIRWRIAVWTRRADPAFGESLESCTCEVNVGLLNFDLDGRVLTLRVIDTPGFDDTNRSDIATIAGYLEKTWVDVLFRRLAHTSLLGILGIELGRSFQGLFTFIVFPVFGWVGSRAESSECSGDDTLKHIVIVTNMWGEVSPAKGVMREAELKNKFYKQALDRGAQILRHDNTVESLHRKLRATFKRFRSTKSNSRKSRKRWKVATFFLWQRLLTFCSEALRMKDKEAKGELEGAKRELHSKIKDMKSDVRNMGVQVREGKGELDKRCSIQPRGNETTRKLRGDVWYPSSRHRRIGTIRSVNMTVSWTKWKPRDGREGIFFEKILWKHYTRTSWTATPKVKLPTDFWSRHTYDNGLAQTIGGFFTSDEYTAKCKSVEATVDKFYLAALDSDRQAEPEGRTYCIGKIRSGHFDDAE